LIDYTALKTYLDFVNQLKLNEIKLSISNTNPLTDLSMDLQRFEMGSLNVFMVSQQTVSTTKQLMVSSTKKLLS
jgi:hypothetical protein